jgi:hypothetical protein
VRAIGVFFSLLLSVVACGGSAVVDMPTLGSENKAGAGGAFGGAPPDNQSLNAGVGGALGGAPPDNQIQVVDDVGDPGGPYPQAPGSAFFWRYGLGNWFVSGSDGSFRDASVDDVIPPRGSRQKAYHAMQTKPGVAVDLFAQLHHPQGDGVDLTAYAGVSFWARLDSPSGQLTVAFGANGQFSKLASVPQEVVPISGDWTQFLVRFADLDLDRTSVSSIDFVLGSSSEPLGLWVDDLGFSCQGNCP